MPGVRRQAQEGVLPGGDRLQGLGLLPHGQPEERHGRGSGDQGQGQVARRVLLLYPGLRQQQPHSRQDKRTAPPPSPPPLPRTRAAPTAQQTSQPPRRPSPPSPHPRARRSPKL